MFVKIITYLEEKYCKNLHKSENCTLILYILRIKMQSFVLYISLWFWPWQQNLDFSLANSFSDPFPIGWLYFYILSSFFSVSMASGSASNNADSQQRPQLYCQTGLEDRPPPPSLHQHYNSYYHMSSRSDIDHPGEAAEAVEEARRPKMQSAVSLMGL